MVVFAVTVPFAPWCADPVRYFRGGFVSDTSKDASNWIVLSSSAFVSWIFAKGILNASTLGASFGVVGGLAYAAWFVAFFSIAFVVYFMRTQHGYRSLPEAIHARYGGFAALTFGVIVAYRWVGGRAGGGGGGKQRLELKRGNVQYVAVLPLCRLG